MKFVDLFKCIYFFMRKKYIFKSTGVMSKILCILNFQLFNNFAKSSTLDVQLCSGYDSAQTFCADIHL